MTTNPYKAPNSSPSANSPQQTVEERLRRIAKYRRGLTWSIAGHAAVIGIGAPLLGLTMLVPYDRGSISHPATIELWAIAVGQLVVSLTGTVSVILLSRMICSMTITIAFSLFAPFPVIGPTVLFLLNLQATEVLKQHRNSGSTTNTTTP